MEVYIGIDWSDKKHDVHIMDETGRKIGYMVIEHSESGFEKLEKWREEAGIAQDKCRIGLETAHNLLLDFLWSRNYREIYVVPPNVVHASRPRYTQGGAHDDKRDAYIISDLLRTDGHRFRSWDPGSELLQQMRASISTARFYTKQTTALANRLKALLKRYHPKVLRVFTNWPSPIACHLIKQYPTPQSLETMSYDDFVCFLKAHRHSHSKKWLEYYDLLTAPAPTANKATVLAFQNEAVQLADLLLGYLQLENATLAQLQLLFQQHEDRHIFESLPGAGTLLAPSLLVKFGEDRSRFSSASAIQALAGTAPVTKQSGSSRYVKFRLACDKELRYFFQQFARCSISQSPWAAAYFSAHLNRGHSKSHAYRCLANRWASIIWKIWQDRTTYDEGFHIQQRQQRRAPKA